jgi:hypothetical protein
VVRRDSDLAMRGTANHVRTKSNAPVLKRKRNKDYEMNMKKSRFLYQHTRLSVVDIFETFECTKY